MYDTHCHLTFPQLSGRLETVIEEGVGAGVRGFVTVSTTTADAAEALRLARSRDRIWCTAGVHPLYADEPAETARDWDALRTIAEDDRCVAWGELGLDNHYERPARAVQDALLAEQLAVLERLTVGGLAKPVIVHCRKAFADLLPVLRSSSLPADRFVFHCFTGTPEEARAVLDFGAWISFTGVVTYPSAAEVAEAATLVPLDRIMVETDAPYLAPAPHRGTFPNEPKHVVHVARFIAGRRGIDEAEFEATLDANAERFFRIEAPAAPDSAAAADRSGR